MNTDQFAPTFRYQCQIQRVINADTFDLMVDHGLVCYSLERVKLLNVDCPEKSTVSGRAALTFVLNWVSIGNNSTELGTDKARWPFIVQTYRANEWGAWCGVIMRRLDGAVLNQDLIDSGHYKVIGP